MTVKHQFGGLVTRLLRGGTTLSDIEYAVMCSLVDALPMCSTCCNAPFCGVRPTHNYMLGGDLFGQRPNTPKCEQHMSIAEMLFDRMVNDPSGRVETIFRRWTIQRPREI